MEENMKIYEKLKLEILLFNCTDVITTSPGNVNGDNEFEDPFVR